jgi:Domain of unknown function (DUF4166)
MKPNRKPQDGRKPELSLGDTRFRALLTEAEWNALSGEVRRRFSKRVADEKSIIYTGEVVEARFSIWGRLLAQAARVIGAPLPLHSDIGVAAVVTVTEDARVRGQVWTRLYARRRGFPQVIHTSKRFQGPTGLEEYLGYGVGMSLAVTVEDGAIVFRSVDYFFDLFGLRLKLPALLSPGDLTIKHAETGAGRFSFTLDLTHKRLGLLIRQQALFHEVAS